MIMKMPDAKVYVARTLCIMVAVPMVFLAVYPLVYLLLPESAQRLADLPQDLTVALLVGDVAVPLYSAWLYYRARRRVLMAPQRIREKQDTRDVL